MYSCHTLVTYLVKKQMVPGKGMLDVVPWVWIEKHCSDLMAYRE